MIEELAANVQRLEADLREARNKLHAAMIEAHHIKVGSLVTSGTRCAQVTCITISDDKWFRYWGRRVLKSGKLHANESQLWWVS